MSAHRLFLVFLLLNACSGGKDSAIDSGVTIDSGTIDSGTIDSSTIDSGQNSSARAIDILFVVDNSISMAEEQTSLAANFSRFVNVLQDIEGGLPDLHIGVVSSDVGAGPYNINSCAEDGDNGVLQSAAQGACSPPGPEPFIINSLNEDQSRTKNYTGNLAEAFSCIARLGIKGCGFEQPLESMRRALNGSNLQNAGFLRDDAYLAIIIITDEDDCSADDVAMYDSAFSLDTANSSLGFLSSFRCFEFGVVCQPDAPRVIGPKVNCVPREDSMYMAKVSGYASFLKGLKSDPSRVIVAGIIGNPTPVSVGDFAGKPGLEPSCGSGVSAADPGIRLQALLDSFPGRSTSATICNEDLSDALVIVAELLADVIGS